jgi:hypothetical protein
MNIKWKIDYSRDAEKFIQTHGVLEEIREELTPLLHKDAVESTAYPHQKAVSTLFEDNFQRSLLD